MVRRFWSPGCIAKLHDPLSGSEQHLETDLPREAADTQIIHDRYKDLAMVEQAFRSCKTDFLEVRPVYVQREKSTWGHVLVAMLAYMIVRALREAWPRSR
jgi:hypothetical protein